MSTTKKWYIGIDFGTSNTSIAAYEATEDKMYVGLASDFSDAHLNVPTLITEEEINREKQIYVGARAQEHPCLTMFRRLKDAARSYFPEDNPLDEYGRKYRLTDDWSFGNYDFIHQEKVRMLVILFLKKVLHVDDDTHQIKKNTLQKIVIGCPANTKLSSGTSVTYEATLKDLLTECFGVNEGEKTKFKKKIEVITEPQLAGVTYLCSDKARADKKVLVIDIGGGTTDFSVLEYKDGKPTAKDIGSCNVAGNEIDNVIFKLLPEGMTRSKVRCQQQKEKLFVKDIDGKIVVPYSTADLGKTDESHLAHYVSGSGQGEISIHYSQRVGNDCIVLAEGMRYNGNATPKSGKAIGEVFDEICAELKNALDTKGVKGINTVLFVGGTSFITPLREKLVNIVKDGNYCVWDFDKRRNVVTTFGDDTRKLQFGMDGDPVEVTCYNAVAFGALIMAMGNKIKIRPEIQVEMFNQKLPLSSTGNELLIVTEKGVRFAMWSCERDLLDYYITVMNNYTGGTALSFCCTIDKTKREYKIEKISLERNTHNIVIVAILTKDADFTFEAYYYDGKASPTLKDISRLEKVRFTEV